MVMLRAEDVFMCVTVQGYLAHKKPPPPRNLPKDHTQGPIGVPRGVGVFL